MKFNPGRLKVGFDFIDGNGEWMPAAPGAQRVFAANTGGFLQAQGHANEQVKRADRRNVKIIYHPGPPEIDLAVESWAEVSHLIETEWVDANESRTERWCLCIGNPDDGFHIVGPFENRDLAMRYGNHMEYEEWWPMRMNDEETS